MEYNVSSVNAEIVHRGVNLIVVVSSNYEVKRANEVDKSCETL